MTDIIGQGLSPILLIGLILFIGTAGGRLFQRLRIPQVVGYIVMGIILGQSGLRLISLESLSSLENFSSFALALIGFMIGGELKIKTLKRFGRQFAWILLCETLLTFAVVALLVTAGSYLLLHDVGLALSLGVILGAIASATAPAATTDVLWENKTRGPLTTTILGLVAMDDGVALILFAIATSIAGALLGTATDGLGASLLRLAAEIGGSLAMGGLFGWLLSLLVKGLQDKDRILVFSLGLIILIIGLTQLLALDTILCAMAMGFFMANVSPKKSKTLFGLVEKFTPPVYVLFFVLVGAKLNIGNIDIMIALLALIFLIGRTGGKFLGATLGAVISGAPASVRKYLPYCLLSQAGVAIGLSVVAGNTFPQPLGDIIVMVITTTTFVVQLTGPPSVKFAVKAAGEAGLNVTAEDIMAASRAADLVTSRRLIGESQTVQEILTVFLSSDSTVFPVTDGQGALRGVINLDILKESFKASDLSPLLLAHDIMLTDTLVCPEATPAPEVFELLEKQNREFLIIVDGENNPTGVLEESRARRNLSLKVMELLSKADQLAG